jgi:thymidylate synthase
MGFMNKLDKDYTDLLQDILDNGTTKSDRTGTGTISVFGRQIRHDMKEGFPLLTTKKMPFKTIVTELLWFLRGETNIKYLVDNNCHIWDGDCYKSYEQSILESFDRLSNDPVIDAMPPKVLTQEEFINKIKTDDEFAKKWGELGPIYGKQWRSWGGELVTKRIKEEGKFPVSQNVIEGQIDQIQNLINDLKTNPDSRRLMVNAWNVGELDSMVLPPCHYGFQVYTRELSLEERVQLAYKSIESTDGTSAALLWELSCQGKSESEILDALNGSSRNIPIRAISLMWNQRSVDTFLGLPFNIASYGLLLEIIAKEVNMVPDQLIGNLGDVHLYSNHIEQAKEQIGREFTEEEILEHLQQSGMDALKYEPRMEYISKLPKRTREPFPLPKLVMNPIFLANLEHKGFDEAINGEVNFQVENYQSHPAIKAPLSN